MGFLSHYFGSRYSRRSIKGSKGVDDRLLSNKVRAKVWLMGLAPRAR